MRKLMLLLFKRMYVKRIALTIIKQNKHSFATLIDDIAEKRFEKDKMKISKTNIINYRVGAFKKNIKVYMFTHTYPKIWMFDVLRELQRNMRHKTNERLIELQLEKDHLIREALHLKASRIAGYTIEQVDKDRAIFATYSLEKLTSLVSGEYKAEQNEPDLKVFENSTPQDDFVVVIEDDDEELAA